MFTFNTNLKKKTEELEREGARLEASINSINVGYIITNEEGEIKTINNAAKALFCSEKTGMRSDPKLVTLKCNMTDIAKQLGENFDIKTAISKVLKDKKPFTIRNLRYKTLYLNISITPIVLLKKEKSINLEFIGSVILIEDVTEEKVLEKSRADFFSIASHELKTPLTIIKGNVELIKKYYPQKAEKLNQILDDMYESSIRLIDIVNDFLDLSHLEQGKIEFRKDKLELNDLTESVVRGLKQLSDQKKMYVKVVHDASKIFVLADKYRVQQVLINLIDNALKFTESGGVIIHIQELGKQVTINVTDTGIGIPSQNQNLVFKKFALAGNDNLSRGSSRNTGVGLYISRYLARGMGGELKLDYSEEGKGSVFSFILPKI